MMMLERLATVSDSHEFRFKSVYEFVDQFILVTYATTAGRIEDENWAPEWWSHPEAVLRLHGLWMLYETMRKESPATYVDPFLRVSCDYHMRFLMQPDGVFAACNPDDSPSVPLKTTPVDEMRG
jgi:hypothetical protein